MNIKISEIPAYASIAPAFEAIEAEVSRIAEILGMSVEELEEKCHTLPVLLRDHIRDLYVKKTKLLTSTWQKQEASETSEGAAKKAELLLSICQKPEASEMSGATSVPNLRILRGQYKRQCARPRGKTSLRVVPTR